MSSALRALSLHVLCLLLAAPLFFLWARSADKSISGPQIWGLFAAATIYIFVASMVRPKLIYDGVLRIGLTPKVLRLALLAVALIMISVPLIDHNSQTVSILGLGVLIFSAIAYVLALRAVLHIES